MADTQTNTLFHVPNNEEGKLFLCLAKKYLNKDSYQLKARGRKPNHKKLKRDGKKASRYTHGIPCKYADRLGVYLMGKNGDKDVQRIGIDTLHFMKKVSKEAYENELALREKNNRIKGLIERILNAKSDLDSILLLADQII